MSLLSSTASLCKAAKAISHAAPKVPASRSGSTPISLHSPINKPTLKTRGRKSEGIRRPATFSDFLIHPSAKEDKSKRVSNNGNKRIGASSFNTTMLRKLKPSIPDSCNRERSGAVIEDSGKSRSSSAAGTPSNRGRQLQIRLFMACRSPIQKGDGKPPLSLKEASVSSRSSPLQIQVPPCGITPDS